MRKNDWMSVGVQGAIPWPTELRTDILRFISWSKVLISKKKEKCTGPRRTCSFYREHWLVVQMISFPRYLTFLSPRVVLLGLMEKHLVPTASSVRWELVPNNKCCVSYCSAAPAFFLTFSAMIWLSLYSSYWEKNLWKCMLTNVLGKNVGLIVCPVLFWKGDSIKHLDPGNIHLEI